MVLFDLLGQKVYLFGLVLLPPDLIYLAAWLITCAVTLFLATTVVGRVFCGFACPHTVYTEIFMWIERKIEGGRSARIRLDKQPWSPLKLGKKAFKHGLWGLLAFWTGFTFVAFFMPASELLDELGTLTLGSWPLFWIAAYGVLAYGNAGWMREQICHFLCPYSRFQSVMMDKSTLVITYDAERGEPRGLRNRKRGATALETGDCVDCTLCVQVCPTGSDIRNGLQYDCIGCAACIDACNLVMDKVGLARGLIRYAAATASFTERSDLVGRNPLIHAVPSSANGSGK